MAEELPKIGMILEIVLAGRILRGDLVGASRPPRGRYVAAAHGMLHTTSLQWILHTAHCTLHTEHYTLHTAYYTLHTKRINTKHKTLKTKHYTLHTANKKLNTAHCTRYTTFCTLQTVQLSPHTLRSIPRPASGTIGQEAKSKL